MKSIHKILKEYGGMSKNGQSVQVLRLNMLSSTYHVIYFFIIIKVVYITFFKQAALLYPPQSDRIHELKPDPDEPTPGPSSA